MASVAQPDALAIAAAGDPRVAEVRRDVDATIDVVADLSRRVRVLERTLKAVHAFAVAYRHALEDGSRSAAYDAVFDLRSATGAQLDDLRAR